MPNMIETIKKVAMDAFEASSPVKVVFGTVLSASPLKIKVEQKLTLGASNLVITKTADGALASGNKVVMIRMQGGQQYIIVDKVVG